MEKALQIKNFNLWLGLNGQLTHILKDINIDVPYGKITGIVGASGSGKSMLLKSILHLFEGISRYKTDGQILVSKDENQSINIISTASNILIENRKNHFGFVFQLSSEVLNPSQKISQQLVERLNLVNYQQNKLSWRCKEVLKLVGIENAELTLNKYPHQLSGGQLQRVLIALGIVHSPKILLIDEPTSALNSQLKVEILDLISTLRDTLNMTIILVSHNMELVSNYCDYLCVIHEGRIIEKGYCKNVIISPHHDITKELLGLSLADESRGERVASDGFILSLVDIEHGFTSSKGLISKQKQNVLNGFNLKIKKGEIIGLVGESGSGKSTIGKIIAGLLMADSGNVYYKNKQIDKLTKVEYLDYRSNVQIIFQDPLGSLSPHRTGRQVMKEALDVLNEKYDQILIENKLAEVSLDPSILEKTPKQMSGGQRQRLLIARALLSKPQLLVCDEILSSLDTIIKKQIIHMLKVISYENKIGILFISHDLETVKDISDRIIMMDS